VQNAIIGNDNSLLGGLLGAVVLIAANAVVVRAARNDAIDRALEGAPTVLVSDGELDHEALRDLGLRKAEVITAIRRQGANTIGEVERASIEPGGTIVVTLKPEDQNASKGDIRRLERKLDRLLATRG
jgi:uncharacterized membrane protein YcaP (DUF421 family)